MRQYTSFTTTFIMNKEIFVYFTRIQIIGIIILGLLVLQLPASIVSAQSGDDTSPSPIINLVAETGDMDGTVNLTWIAPGDDGSSGTATTYIVRYNTVPISENNWGTSIDVIGEPTPVSAGGLENMTIGGFTSGKVYYFAIKSQDEVGNTSSISNLASATAQSSLNTVYLPLIISSGSNSDTIIPDTTKILPGTTTQYLSGISGDGAVFTFTQSTPVLESLSSGNIIVSDVATNAPYGFLRKVTSVLRSGNQVIIQTESTTLEDAVQKGSVQLEHTLTPNQINGGTAIMGVELIRAIDVPDEFYFQLNDVVLYDEDGNTNTTNDQIKASGDIRLAPDYDFSFQISQFKLKELSFIANVKEL